MGATCRDPVTRCSYRGDMLLLLLVYVQGLGSLNHSVSIGARACQLAFGSGE